MLKPAVLVTDIEGTTTSLSFVHEVLFPHSARELPRFVREHRADAAITSVLAEVKDAGQAERPVETLEDAIELLLHWIATDRKHPALKRLQGMIWRHGYEEGQFRGHVYPDVAPALEAWRARGLRLAVFSSGSIEAQKLLFGHSTAGDLTGLFEAFFDTGVGPKQTSSSYARIATELGVDPRRAWFFSDVIAELDAAKLAGMNTLQVVRPGVSHGIGHPTAADFTLATELLFPT